MRVLASNLLASVKGKYRSKTNYKIYRKTENGWKVINNVEKADVVKVIQSQEKHEDVREQHGQEEIVKDEIKASNDEFGNQEQPNYRQNEMKIQMLSQPLYQQIFKDSTKNDIDRRKVQRFCNKIAAKYFNLY